LAYDRPIVMVMVNEKGPFRFLVDTGLSAEVYLTTKLARKLNLPLTGKAYVADPSGQETSAAVVSIQSLRVAGVEFAAVRAITHPFDGEGVSFEGVLGFPLFHDYLLTLDFPKRELRLKSGALLSDGGQHVLPFITPLGVPTILLRIDASTIGAEVDSGGLGLSLPKAFASRLSYFSVPDVFAVEQTISRRFNVGGATLASYVQFGTYALIQPFVAIDPVSPLANFGSTAMQDFALTFDQTHDLVLFEARRKLHSLNVPPIPGTCSQIVPSC
jgi:Aspartyl protease